MEKIPTTMVIRPRPADVQRAGSGNGPKFDEDGLILPKKLHNPCIESETSRQLNHEIKWNAKTGVNVLEKSELQKVMRDRQWKQKQIAEKESLLEKTPFQAMIEARAAREVKASLGGENSNSSNSSSSSGNSSPEPVNEILKARAKLRHPQSGVDVRT